MSVLPIGRAFRDRHACQRRHLLFAVCLGLAAAAASRFAEGGEPPNLVKSPALEDRSAWDEKKGDEAVFSFAKTEGAIRVKGPGRYAALNQELKLQPNSHYRLSAEVKASGSMYVRVRALQAGQKQGETAKAFDLNIQKNEAFVPYAARFSTGPAGRAILIVGVTEDSGEGEFFVRNLSVVESAPVFSSGEAIPVKAGDEPLVVTKIPVTDCRSLRGFIGAPVDGSLKSGRWNGGTWEYNERGAGAGVGYAYRNSDGLHITLADKEGFNAVLVRGGVKAKLYRDCAKYDDPSSGTLLYEFPGEVENSRAFFKDLVKTDRVSFFDVGDGHIADCSFYRVWRGLGGLKETSGSLRLPDEASLGNYKGLPINQDVLRQLESRFAADDRHTHLLRPATPDLEPGQTLFRMPAGKALHFISTGISRETPLAALGVEFNVTWPKAAIPFSASVQDPLNPRLDLLSADYILDTPGRVRLVFDFPDQIVPKDAQFWMTLRFESPADLTDLVVTPYIIPREKALPEALAHRKFLLKSFYAAMSEARPWNEFYRPEDIEKFYAKGGPYVPCVREIFTTLEQCRALDPDGKDDTVRQYYQWLHRHILRKSKAGMPPFTARFDKMEGVPEWAVLAHQAWMQSREVAKWWVENRMTPNGEFGGGVGDDTDLLGNFQGFPMFERDGVGGMVLDAGARLAETAEALTLEQGLNKRSMDPLHAYEEGLNLEAQMLHWFYGDPVYTERCIVAARSTEALTVRLPNGHRHFRNQECGAADLRVERKLGIDGGTHPLMWHPALEAAWYNRNPKIVSMLREWADGWLEHGEPGKYATSIDISGKAETVVEHSPRPLSGGFGSQGSAHMFLAEFTGDARYVKPYLDFLAAGQHDGNSLRALPELMQMGMFDVPPERCKAAIAASWPAQLYLRGDKAPLIKALKADIEELQRFPHMYTTCECFTDRVFLYALTNPSIAYTGGFATRNKLNQTYAVSYEGLGTDYAALVLASSSSRLKILLCNLSDKPLEGRARVWRLEHGEYDLALGPDADGDDVPDKIESAEKIVLARASPVALRLPPRSVQVLELKQAKKLDDIFKRADLALCTRELKIEGGKVSGRAHNIGSAAAENVEIVLLDSSGKVVARKALGPLAAPLDLQPKALEFEFSGVRPEKGWSVQADPDEKLPEIYEGNNRAAVPHK